MSNLAVRDMTMNDRALGIAWLENVCREKAGISGGSFPVDFFPETGVTCDYNGTPAAVITIYLELTTNSAILGFCMLNNELPAKIRHAAAEKALAGAVDYLRKLGKKYVLSMFGNRAVNRMADRLGFITADDCVEEKIYHIK